MLYLSGANNAAVRGAMAAGRLGLLQTPGSRYRLDGVPVWALDNGAFTGRYPGDDAYLALLDGWAAHRSRCLFVVVPDVVGDAAATLALFDGMRDRIAGRGWPVALAGQDGMTPDVVPWGRLDWLFVGGSTGWKLGGGAAALIGAARARGVRVHVGRVNSWRRFAYFAGLGCDSADGTFVAFGPDRNLRELLGWLDSPVQLALG